MLVNFVRWMHIVFLISAIWQAAVKNWSGAFGAMATAYVALVLIAYFAKRG